jgi:glycerol-3-phosphate O-acyltransferase / dihydroxyacetone phosphate acyltransferase
MQTPPSTYVSITKLVGFLLARWFRRIEVTGLEHLPSDGGGILVSWHPNGLVDPALIVSSFPGQVVFGARHGLFRWPILGRMMRATGALPIYRAMDASKLSPEERRAQNRKSLDALADAVADGRFSCLFPEGDSHDSPHVLELKTGVARFYERALELTPPERPAPVIIPVGLHYDDKHSFRSHALVAFHRPLALVAAAGSSDDTARYQALTDRVEKELSEVVHATESWELHHLMHRARKVVATERAKRAGEQNRSQTMADKAEIMSTVWDAYYRGVEAHPEEVALLRAKVSAYHKDMRALGLEDHELDDTPQRAQLLAMLSLVGQIIAVFILLPPLLVFGVVVNLPAGLVLLGASKVFAQMRKDEATIKLLLGALLLPASWALAGWLAYRGSETIYRLDPALPDAPFAAAAVVVSLGIVGGMAAMRYLRLSRETIRAVGVRLTRGRRKGSMIRLRAERAEIYEGFVELADELGAEA